jgi:hypothetical protein
MLKISSSKRQKNRFVEITMKNTNGPENSFLKPFLTYPNLNQKSDLHLILEYLFLVFNKVFSNKVSVFPTFDRPL